MRRWILLAAAVAIAGCGGSEPSPVPVSGTVTFNGKVLEGAEISFQPDPSNPALPPGFDKSGPQGNYKAMSRGRSGLVPGKYKVKVHKDVVDEAALSKLPEEIRNDPGMVARALASQRRVKSGPDAGAFRPDPKDIDEQFDREVPPEGGVLDFDLKGAAKAAEG